SGVTGPGATPVPDTVNHIAINQYSQVENSGLYNSACGSSTINFPITGTNGTGVDTGQVTGSNGGKYTIGTNTATTDNGSTVYFVNYTLTMTQAPTGTSDTIVLNYASTDDALNSIYHN